MKKIICILIGLIALTWNVVLADDKVQLKNVSNNGSGMKASFSEVSGLDTEQGSVDYRTGSEDKAAAAKKKTKEKSKKEEEPKKEEPKKGEAKKENSDKAEKPTPKPDSGVKSDFSEASGLDTEQDPVDYRTGEEDRTMKKIPGLKKSSNTSQNPFGTSDKLKQTAALSPSAHDINSMEMAEMRQGKK